MKNATIILLIAGLLNGCGKPSSDQNAKSDMNPSFDWQGHRGARGLVPENTIPSFLKALEYPKILTIELDVVVSADSLVVVSHEPWMSAAICSHPDGRPVAGHEEEALNLFQMPYDQIRLFDCGSRGNDRFPEQKPEPAFKPLLEEVITAVEAHCLESDKTPPRYNIEIKSDPDWDDVKTPKPETFARLVVELIRKFEISQRVCIQSFDVRSIQAVHRLDSTLTTALLVANADGVAGNLEKLGYVPQIYSPNYTLVTANVVRAVHDRGMKIIPWTVNDTTSMKALIELGVDGIITDYPDRAF